DLSDKQRVSASFFWGKNVLDFLSVDEDLRTADFQYHEIEHWGVNASWSARWNNRWSTSVIISNSAYKLNYEYLYQREIIPDEEEEGIIDKAWLKDEDEEDDGEGDEDEEDNENEGDEDEDMEENEEDLEDPNEGDGFFDDRFEDAPDSLQDRGSWNNSLNYTEIKVVQSLSLQNANLDLGFQYNHLEIKYALREENLFDEDKVQAFYEKGSSFALFSDFSLGRGYSYSIDIGSRVNYFEFVDVFTIDPQFSGSYSPTNWFTLKASGGTYHQLIRTLRDFENSISNTSEEIWFVSDAEEIPVIKNQQLNAGFLIQHRGWLFDVEAYTKKLTGLSTFNYSFGSASIDDYEEGEETIRGVDVLLRKRFARHRSWVSYSYSKSESFFEDISDDPFPSSLDQPHKLTISQSYSTPKFEVSLGWTVKSGIPYTAPVSDEAERVITIIAEDDNDADNLEEQYYAIQYDGINNRRLPVYHRLDASFWFFFSGRSPSGFNGKLGISMLNILNQQNVHTRNFFVDDDPDIEENDFVEVFREERYLLGFTPNITLSLRF
ncbi:MAG: hypothetical protein MI700_13340, partial [Balneolales bacterium]|nr:hypothetical protein [Balneolales bacterium]